MPCPFDFADHVEGQPPLASQNLGRARLSDQGRQISTGAPFRLHSRLNRFHRVQLVDRPPLPLIFIDQCCQHVETILVRAARFRVPKRTDFVNRRPMAPGETEALYRVHAVCPANVVSAARDLLFDELETHHYPIREMETLAEGDTQVELAAILVPTTANPADLDSITAHIARHEGITSATWTVSATN